MPSPQSGRSARLLVNPANGSKSVHRLSNSRKAPIPTAARLSASAAGPRSAPPASPPSPGITSAAAAPAVRALARERGVDLAGVSGTGPGGAITREDVERAAASTGNRAEPLRGIRRAMAVNMARAHAEVVPATLWDEADIEAWSAPAADVALRLIRAIAAGCMAMPALNAWYDGEAMSRRLLPDIDLGVAVDTEDGLIVPVLRDIAHRDDATLRHDIDTLKHAARARTIAPADLRDPTITLSNFGMLAGRQAALVIVPPQVAIVGAGRIALAAVPSGRGISLHLSWRSR